MLKRTGTRWLLWNTANTRMVETEAAGAFSGVRWKNNNKPRYIIKTALYLNQNTHIEWKWPEVNTNNKISGVCMCRTLLTSPACLPHAVPEQRCRCAVDRQTDSGGDSGISYLPGIRYLWTRVNFTNLEKRDASTWTSKTRVTAVSFCLYSIFSIYIERVLLVQSWSSLRYL